MRIIQLLLISTALLFLANCSSSRQLALAPIKTFDPDNQTIPPPKNLEENQIWDLIYFTGIYQIGKPLDLNWTFEKIGKILNMTPGKQADNVNRLDEVPNSSWFTNRHFQKRMSLADIKRGSDSDFSGPDRVQPWVITRGKFEGGTPGFTIRDDRGDLYIIKFDAAKYPEMGSSAEVISTKILYACGYYVPQNSIVYIHPKNLLIGETAKVLKKGFKRKMTQADLDAMLNDIPRRADGKIRVLASKFVDGKPVGVWEYRGTRKDDPNDRVFHEHRRELRGLRVISSWLNDADRRSANTLAVYSEENGRKFIKHYIIDMGSTLGSNNNFPHAPKYGYEYLTDPRSMAKSFVALGLYVKPWEFITEDKHPKYPSVGYFESKIFNPGTWVPTYPNPAFEKATLRDAYWGAKIVMSFTDEDIRAIVEEARLTNTEAQEYLIKILIERRDKIGRYWFSRMNPLDHFSLENDAAGNLLLKFHDLAVDGRLESAETTRYYYSIFHKKKQLKNERVIDEPLILLSQNDEGLLDSQLKSTFKEADKIFKIKINTKRNTAPLSYAVTVSVYYPGNFANARIVGIERED